MMTAEQLRGSLLQMAVEGKLVDQIEQEGTGSDLFDLIQKKKKQAIKEKKIKEVKFDSMIPDDEKVFDIPTRWKWCRLGSLAIVITKGTTPRGGNVAYLEDGIGFLRAENIAGLDKLDLSNLKYVDEETNQGFLGRSIIETNDILITIAGTLGRTGLVREENLPLNANQAVSIVRFATPNDLDLKYLIYVLNAPAVKKALSVQKKITAIPNLTLEIIANCVIPLPPLAEQKRIVAKIEELMPLVEKYAAASTKLNTLNATFPEMMKKSILQEAVQGKLVPQDPNDEPASVLLEKIAEEKKRLIKEGKIKKQKPLPEITEDEIPFDIPESWEWVRVNDVLVLENGDRSSKYPKETDYVEEGIPFFGARDMVNGEMDFSSVRFISKDKYDELGGGKLKDGDLVCLLRGSVGKIACFYENEHYSTGFICAQMVIMRLIIKELLSYIQIMTETPYYQKIISSKVTGTAVRQLPAVEISKVVIPIPPLQEQKRIVSKVHELMLNVIELTDINE